jgi:hypothetical protein
MSSLQCAVASSELIGVSIQWTQARMPRIDMPYTEDGSDRFPHLGSFFFLESEHDYIDYILVVKMHVQTPKVLDVSFYLVIQYTQCRQHS